MILSKLIVRWLEWIVEIGIWLCLAGAFIAGARTGSGIIGSLVAGTMALLVAGLVCAVVFGFFILLNDIRTMMKKAIEDRPNGSSARD